MLSAPARLPACIQGDVINSVAVLPGAADPYVLLGCESGNVRIVALLDSQGNPASGTRPAADLALQPPPPPRAAWVFGVAGSIGGVATCFCEHSLPIVCACPPCQRPHADGSHTTTSRTAKHCTLLGWLLQC